MKSDPKEPDNIHSAGSEFRSNALSTHRADNDAESGPSIKSGPFLAGPKYCACGCGRIINPTRTWHVYATTSCRVRAYKKKEPKKSDYQNLNERLRRLEDRVRILESSANLQK